MHKLLEFEAFENFMNHCFFQSLQMESKTLYNPKQSSKNLFIASHKTCFIDSSFDQAFQNKQAKLRPVKISAMDAGWIFKSKEGMDFLKSLASSDRMELFLVPAIKHLIIFQWTQIYPIIRNRLFIPFLLIFLSIHFYFIYGYESQVYVRRSNAHEQEPIEEIQEGFHQFMIWYKSFQGVLILWQIYIQIMQVWIHSFKGFLRNFWNLFDLFSVIFLILIIVADFYEFDPLWVRPFIAITFLLFYFRLFYYLRIFD